MGIAMIKDETETKALNEADDDQDNKIEPRIQERSKSTREKLKIM